MMQAYAEYRDSGVDWLGEIPADWEVKRLKYVANERNENVETKETSLDYYGMESVASWSGVLTGAPVQVDGLANLFFRGDVLFGKLRPYLAKIFQSDRNGLCSTEFMVLKPRKNIQGSYLAKFLISPDFVWMVNGSTYGSKMPRANPEYIKNSFIPLPPLPEQTVIAEFLDEKTTKIEALVGIKRRQIELLAERKQILIQNAVTKGLNPDAPMKDSGVEWIGTIPAHWEVKPAKHLFFEVDERSENGDEELLSVSHMTGVTPRSEKTVSMFLAEDYSGSKICVEGDLVFNIMWAWMGALGVSAQLGIVSPSYAVFRQLKSQTFNPVYLEMLMQSLGYIEHYNKVSTGLHSSRLRFYSHMFLSMKIGYPSFEEQERIVQFLAKETGKISKTISVLENQITKLNEYKTTLINAAVTGKIKVT